MENLTELLAERLTDLGVRVAERAMTDGGADLRVVVPTRDGDRTVGVDVKHRARPPGPLEVERWRATRSEETILGLTRVTSRRGEQYRALGINYVDAAGNASLRYPGFVAQVEGRKAPVDMARGPQPRRATANPAGLRAVFALLLRPTLLAEPYETLAEMAMISKGSATNAVLDLRERGHVLGERRDRILTDVARLGRDWVDGYIDVLRPRLEERRLRGPEPTWWRHSWFSDGDDSRLGGGLALAHLGAPIRPDHAVVYGTPPWAQVRRGARLSQQGEAEVILRQRFWSPELDTDLPYVPPLLAYADAMAGGTRARRRWRGSWAVIGSFARDYRVHTVAGLERPAQTLDVDVAVLGDSWEDYRARVG